MDQHDLDNQGQQDQPHDPSQEQAASMSAEFTSADQLPDESHALKDLVLDREHKIVELRTRNADLQKRIDERETVVQALTSRLEQAAEQLDRIRRNGGDRSGKVLAGIPAEVIDEQRELINDLKAAIGTWEEMQSTSAMGRFESQLAELREMLADQFKIKTKLDKGLPSKSAGDEKSSSKSSGAGGPNSWEQMKAQLMGGESKGEKSPSSDVMIPGAEIVPAASSEQSGQASSAPIEMELKPRPAALDNLESAEQAALVTAVNERDHYIDYLLTTLESVKREAGMTDREEMLGRQKELEEKLRQAEIEMSMERAKLAREAAQLKQREEEMANPKAAKSAESSGSDSEDKGNRWVRFLGSK